MFYQIEISEKSVLLEKEVASTLLGAVNVLDSFCLTHENKKLLVSIRAVYFNNVGKKEYCKGKKYYFLYTVFDTTKKTWLEKHKMFADYFLN